MKPIDSAATEGDVISAEQTQLPTPPATPRKKSPTKKSNVRGTKTIKKGAIKMRLPSKKTRRVGAKR